MAPVPSMRAYLDCAAAENLNHLHGFFDTVPLRVAVT